MTPADPTPITERSPEADKRRKRRERFPLRPVTPMTPDEIEQERQRTAEWLAEPPFRPGTLDVTYHKTARLLMTIDALAAERDQMRERVVAEIRRELVPPRVLPAELPLITSILDSVARGTDQQEGEK